MGEEGWVGDEEAEVDVDWGCYAGFKGEGAEFDGGDVVEAED